MRTMRMLYPERRMVTEHEVTAWALDLWTDSAPRRRCSVCGTVTVATRCGRAEVDVRPGEYRADDPSHPCEVSGCVGDSIPLHTDDQPRPFGLEDCARYLEDAGVATFAR